MTSNKCAPQVPVTVAICKTQNLMGLNNELSLDTQDVWNEISCDRDDIATLSI